MANARQKKKASAPTAQATRKRTRQNDKRQRRAVAARARTEFRKGFFPSSEGGPSRDSKAQSSEPSGEVFRNMSSAQRATEHLAGNLGPVSNSGTIFASAMRSILQELFTFVQEGMHQNFTRLVALSSARTPSQLIAAQMDFVRDNMEGFLRSTSRMADVSMQMGHEGVWRMSAPSFAER